MTIKVIVTKKSELLARIEFLTREEHRKKESLIACFVDLKKQLAPKAIAKRLTRAMFVKVKSFLPGFLVHPKLKQE